MNISSDIKNFIKDMPCIAWIKSVNGVYLAVSEFTVDAFLFSKQEDILKKSHFDVYPDSAQKWQDQEDFILRGNTLIRFEAPKRYDQAVTNTLTTTKPFYYRGELVGTFGVGHELSRNVPSSVLARIRASLQQELMDNSYLAKRKRYTYGQINFSNREAQVVSYILRGCTAPKIASELFISRGTAESHIKNIKEKCECTKKSEIFDKALQLGFIDLLLLP